MKVKVVGFMLVLALALVLSSLLVARVNASETAVIYASLGQTNWNDDAVYLTCNSEVSSSNIDPDYSIVGQSLESDNYYIYRSPLRLDTSILKDKNIQSVKLGLYGVIAFSEASFFIRVQRWTDADDGMGNDDYSKFANDYLDDGGFASSSFQVGVYNNISLTALNLINQAGYTDIFLRSSKDIEQTAPVDVEYLYFDGVTEVEGTHPPFLEITYTEGATAGGPPYGEGPTVPVQLPNVPYWVKQILQGILDFLSQRTVRVVLGCSFFLGVGLILLKYERKVKKLGKL